MFKAKTIHVKNCLHVISYIQGNYIILKIKTKQNKCFINELLQLKLAHY